MVEEFMILTSLNLTTSCLAATRSAYLPRSIESVTVIGHNYLILLHIVELSVKIYKNEGMKVRSTVFDSSLMSRVTPDRPKCSRDFFLPILRPCKPKGSSSSSSRTSTLDRCSGILRSDRRGSFGPLGTGEDVACVLELETRG